MLVVFLERCQVLEPLINILNQAALIVIHVYAGCDVHRRNQHHAFFYTASANNILHLWSDMDVCPMCFCMKLQVFRESLHRNSEKVDALQVIESPRRACHWQSSSQGAPGRGT